MNTVTNRTDKTNRQNPTSNPSPVLYITKSRSQNFPTETRFSLTLINQLTHRNMSHKN